MWPKGQVLMWGGPPARPGRGVRERQLAVGVDLWLFPLFRQFAIQVQKPNNVDNFDSVLHVIDKNKHLPALSPLSKPSNNE
jgi:hypothetical protein